MAEREKNNAIVADKMKLSGSDSPLAGVEASSDGSITIPVPQLNRQPQPRPIVKTDNSKLYIIVFLFKMLLSEIRRIVIIMFVL